MKAEAESGKRVLFPGAYLGGHGAMDPPLGRQDSIIGIE